MGEGGGERILDHNKFMNEDLAQKQEMYTKCIYIHSSHNPVSILMHLLDLYGIVRGCGIFTVFIYELRIISKSFLNKRRSSDYFTVNFDEI